jgi:hypothetical protein
MAAPAYLSEIVNNPKEISKAESIDAYDKLPNKAKIAIRSLKNGGFIYAKSDNDSTSIKTLVTRGSATFLAYTSTSASGVNPFLSSTSTTPIQFTVLKNKRCKAHRCIVLRSNFMEDKVLTLNPKTNQVTFEEYDPKNAAQQWILKSGDGLNQVYFQNKATGAFLTIEGPNPCMSCKSIETPTTSELFKIVILDKVDNIE